MLLPFLPSFGIFDDSFSSSFFFFLSFLPAFLALFFDPLLFIPPSSSGSEIGAIGAGLETGTPEGTTTTGTEEGTRVESGPTGALDSVAIGTSEPAEGSVPTGAPSGEGSDTGAIVTGLDTGTPEGSTITGMEKRNAA